MRGEAAADDCGDGAGEGGLYQLRQRDAGAGFAVFVRAGVRGDEVLRGGYVRAGGACGDGVLFEIEGGE